MSKVAAASESCQCSAPGRCAYYRRAHCRLECYANACGYVVRLVVSASELAIVIDVGRNAVVPQHSESSPKEQAVATDFRAGNGKAATCTVGETGDKRVC